MNVHAKTILALFLVATSARSGTGVVVDTLGVPLADLVVTRKSDGATTRTSVSGQWTFGTTEASRRKSVQGVSEKASIRLENGRLSLRTADGRDFAGRSVGGDPREVQPSFAPTAARGAAVGDSVIASGPGWRTGSAPYDALSGNNRVVLRMSPSPGMVKVPGGWDSLGSASQWNNLPHAARVGGFWIDSVEVTQKFYDSLMGANPSFHKNCPTCPVERVTWFDAVRFCNARSRAEGLPPAYDISSPDSATWIWNPRSPGYRLPTDAEWEYAARAGSPDDWYWGPFIQPSMVSLYAWYEVNSGDSTHPVAKLLPNALRLYDIAGNVSEWTNDWFKDVGKDSLTFPKGPSTPLEWKVARGGDFQDQNTGVIITSRAPSVPTTRWLALGFRCARGVMP